MERIIEGVGKEKAYEKSLKRSNEIYKSRLIEILDAAKDGNKIIFLDKNHPPNALKPLLEILTPYKFELVYLVPEIGLNVQNYPFSFSFIA